MKILNTLTVVFLILFVNSTALAEDVLSAKKDSSRVDTTMNPFFFYEKGENLPEILK